MAFRIGPRERYYLIVALVVQILYWRFSMPGPQILGDNSPSLEAGVVACLISVLTLLVIPAAAVLIAGDSLHRLGIFSLGDRKFGIKAVAICLPVMVAGTLIGSGDAQIQAYYPIPGTAISESAYNMLLWFGGYTLFYISFEFFYRGFLLKGPQSLGLPACFTIQVVCCVLIHLGKPIAETLASLPASILFGWIAYRSKSVWYCILLHVAVGIANDLGALWQAGAFD